MTKFPRKTPDPLLSGETLLPATDPDIAAMSFEAALKELEQIVDKLEKGTVELEESIAIYARGAALKTHCNDLLKAAEQRIEKITLGANGKPSGTEPLDVE
ncbi:MAG TPA: exodeoxyribonuclease VII small subunit [Methylocella sp.]|nr:exodeoxyribonuclease VII small subunit [Methylocella sp.]